MTKNLKIEDIKPVLESAIDTKPSGRTVLDVKPSMRLIDPETIDFVAIELGRGQSIGPGWYMYVTYPTTTLNLI